MSPQGLNPGDRVVDLAALVRAVAVFTGVTAAGWIAWSNATSWRVRLSVPAIGAMLGYLVGQIVSRVCYRRSGVYTMVVKVGRGSLRSTTKAGLLGGVPAAIVVASAALVFLGVEGHAASLFGLSLTTGIGLGLIFGCLAPLV